MSLDNSISPPCPELTLHRRRGRAHFVLVSTSFCNNGTTGLLPPSTTVPTLLQALVRQTSSSLTQNREVSQRFPRMEQLVFVKLNSSPTALHCVYVNPGPNDIS